MPLLLHEILADVTKANIKLSYFGLERARRVWILIELTHLFLITAKLKLNDNKTSLTDFPTKNFPPFFSNFDSNHLK